ncbi:hypothetical protein, partial [Endozoicomonas numazuensis]|uniref:hypothetical protein n=1 Tax=Endozoicomonas numazuensis TaxID=1137799 RepID=UPI00137881EA
MPGIVLCLPSAVFIQPQLLRDGPLPATVIGDIKGVADSSPTIGAWVIPATATLPPVKHQVFSFCLDFISVAYNPVYFGCLFILLVAFIDSRSMISVIFVVTGVNLLIVDPYDLFATLIE